MVYLQTTYELFWGSVFWIFWIMWFFPRNYKYRCIRVYVWFKDDKHVIWMWIWLMLKNISLLDRIWSLWLIRFAHSPPNLIFWLGRLIFSVSINLHPDNIIVSEKSDVDFVDHVTPLSLKLRSNNGLFFNCKSQSVNTDHFTRSDERKNG